jgi:aminopeptidase N
LFKFPLKIRLKTKSGITDKVIEVKEKSEEFVFKLQDRPEIVRVDPDFVLLARITFRPAREMLLAQLADNTDMIGRLRALNELKKNKDQATVTQIGKRLNEDSFYGIRVEAATALGSIRTPEALTALIASTNQTDARVRNAVTAAIGKFYETKAMDYAVRSSNHEKNPDIASQSLRSLGAYSNPDIRALILKNLESESFDNILASAAVSAIRAQSDAAYIEPLLKVLREKEAKFTARGFADGLDTLAYIARNEEKKDSVYEFIVSYTSSPRRTIQRGAFTALSTLKDERAIAVLSKYAAGSKDDPEAARASRAMESIRAGRPVSTELQTLRTDVLELKKNNDALRKEMDELKKRLEAGSESPRKGTEKKAKAAGKATSR